LPRHLGNDEISPVGRPGVEREPIGDAAAILLVGVDLEHRWDGVDSGRVRRRLRQQHVQQAHRRRVQGNVEDRSWVVGRADGAVVVVEVDLVEAVRKRPKIERRVVERDGLDDRHVLLARWRNHNGPRNIGRSDSPGLRRQRQADFGADPVMERFGSHELACGQDRGQRVAVRLHVAPVEVLQRLGGVDRKGGDPHELRVDQFHLEGQPAPEAGPPFRIRRLPQQIGADTVYLLGHVEDAEPVAFVLEHQSERGHDPGRRRRWRDPKIRAHTLLPVVVIVGDGDAEEARERLGLLLRGRVDEVSSVASGARDHDGVPRSGASAIPPPRIG
jgi:hypothetical protein